MYIQVHVYIHVLFNIEEEGKSGVWGSSECRTGRRERCEKVGHCTFLLTHAHTHLWFLSGQFSVLLVHLPDLLHCLRAHRQRLFCVQQKHINCLQVAEHNISFNKTHNESVIGLKECALRRIKVSVGIYIFVGIYLHVCGTP